MRSFLRANAICTGRTKAIADYRSALAALFFCTLTALGGEVSVTQLANLSLEELTKIEVTSPSKKPEPLSDVAAAVYVITGEDIRRSGATTIAEALRMAPGLDVARINAHNWAITSRGFNDLFANKLLVLIDGRSVYTPLFAGVYWDVQDTLLEDIDRIEVIRGPGATLWGANAVNGVINITTKSSKLTQGGLVVAGYGTEERGFGGVRYGGKFTDEATYRVYAKVFNRDDSELASGKDADDRWRGLRGGFRTDWAPSSENLFTLQGDAYAQREHETYNLLTPVFPFSRDDPNIMDVYGANVVGRWTHTFSADSQFTFQTYYDRTAREVSWFNETRDTYDAEMQYRFHVWKRNDIIIGAGFRLSESYDTVSNFTISYTPPDRQTRIFNTFVQDEISLVRDRLFLTLGSKFEYNNYTDWEIQPSGRLLWKPSQNQSIWGAVSRAVRMPSRSDVDMHLTANVIPPFTPITNPTAFPAVVTIDGNRDFDPEELLAYELGYRIRPKSWLSIDAALFYNDYDRLRSFEPGTPDLSPLPTYIRYPYLFSNLLNGETYGGELAVDAQLTDWWLIRASYSYLQMQLHKNSRSQDTTSEEAERNSPHNKLQIRSLMDLPYHLQFDVWVRYVDSVPGQNIQSYIAVDARLGYRPIRNLDISIVAQSIFDDRHPEYGPSIVREQATEVERAVYGRITWSF